MKKFDASVRKYVDTFLVDRGFKYSNGYFCRVQNSGVRNMIAFDNGGRDSNSYRVMVMVNSMLLDSEAGAHCVTYFTGGSLSDSPRKFPCNSSSVLEAGLNRFVAVYDQIIEPYFIAFKSCADIADSIIRDPALGSYCGDLYALSGMYMKAIVAYESWIDHLLKVKHIADDLRNEAIQETNKKIEMLKNQ